MKKILVLISGTFLILQACSSNESTNGAVQNTFPKLSTISINSITNTSGVSGGNITSNGGSTIIARGVVWNTQQNPTISLTTKSTDGSGIGTFTSNLSGLVPNTKYYLRAYATNSVGTGYGNEITFTTGALVVPTLTTTVASSITTNSAVSGGTITADGGGSITARGVVWSTSTSPTIALNTKTTDGSGTGNYTSTLSGLVPNTIYYIRAYATNNVGTNYGNEITFTTDALIPVSVITKEPVLIDNPTSARTGGYVLNDGGSTIISRGIVWGTAINPNIISNQKIISGNGQGNFVIDLNNLNLNITYHIRAYATNINGTFYGDDVTIILTSNPRLTIGQNYGGGKIGYLDSSGIHGFIVAPSDQSAGARWSGYGPSSFNSLTYPGIGYGPTNTTIITNYFAQGNFTNYAAKICEDLVLNGYDDWFLPSIDELEQICINRNLIGGFFPTWYWSSSNVWAGINGLSNGNSRTMGFTSGNGINSSLPQDALQRVRAVRKF